MNEECSVIKLGEGGNDSRCSLNDSTNEEVFQMKKMFQIKETVQVEEIKQGWNHKSYCQCLLQKVVQEERSELICLRSKCPGSWPKIQRFYELLRELDIMSNEGKNNFNVFNVYILISEYKLKTNYFK